MNAKLILTWNATYVTAEPNPDISMRETLMITIDSRGPLDATIGRGIVKMLNEHKCPHCGAFCGEHQDGFGRPGTFIDNKWHLYTRCPQEG